MRKTKSILLFILCLNFSVYGQQDTTHKGYSLNLLSELYLQGKITGKIYMDTVLATVNIDFANNVRYTSKELALHLALFRELAWNEKKLSSYKDRYYFTLANNAMLRNKGGEAVYFMDKVEKIMKEQHRESLFVLAQKIHFLSTNSSFNKTVKVYERNQKEIREYIDKYKQGTAVNPMDPTIFYLLNSVGHAYSILKDSANTAAIIQLAQELKQVYFKKDSNSNNAAIVDQMVAYIEYYQAEMDKPNLRKAYPVIQRLERIPDAYSGITPAWKAMMLANLINIKAHYFVGIGNQDSAAMYIDKLGKSFDVTLDKGVLLNVLNADLFLIKKDYKNAYYTLKKAFQGEDSLYVTLADNMDELLYTHIESEFNKMEAEKTEKENAQKTKWIISIAFVLAVAVLVIYLRMQRKARIARLNIEHLNNLANIQVATMEEIKVNAVNEEQKRLGRDLHDGLSSLIAGIKNQVALLLLDTQEDTYKVKLQRIQQQVTEAYETARNKSHEWFYDGEELRDVLLATRIKTFVDSVLPDSQYEKEIHIDEHSLNQISIDLRIEILRIIQEAATNIIKHAKAKKVELLIYEEAGCILLDIKDDGKGFSLKSALQKKLSMGLQSMTDRVQANHGTLHIESGSSGTEIHVSIPLPGYTTTI